MTPYILTFLAGVLCASAIYQTIRVIRKRAARKRCNHWIQVVLQQSFERSDIQDEPLSKKPWRTLANFPINETNN